MAMQRKVMVSRAHESRRASAGLGRSLLASASSCTPERCRLALHATHQAGKEEAVVERLGGMTKDECVFPRLCRADDCLRYALVLVACPCGWTRERIRRRAKSAPGGSIGIARGARDTTEAHISYAAPIRPVARCTLLRGQNFRCALARSRTRQLACSPVGPHLG